MKKLLLLFGFAFPILVSAQAGTEIYLFDIIIGNTGIGLGKSQNITNRKGYDNQPFFHPSLPLIYYASFNDSGRSDIKTYNITTGQTSLFTQTNEREYSPTLTPDGQFISCIIERDNHHQDFGKYPVAGGKPVELINNLTVGYHTWINNFELLLYVLKDSGNELHHYNLVTKKDTVLATNIGRSLHKIPGEKAMSFIQKINSKWIIKKLNPATDKISDIVTAYGTGEDLTWTPDGLIIMNEGNKLYYYHPKANKTWLPFSTDVLFVGKKLTRMAVNGTGTKLALVVEE